MMMGTVEVIVNNHVTPLLRDFHWLKVPERVAYKLVVTVYQCLHGMAPTYLCDDLQRVSEVTRRRLRSSTSNAIVVPATRLVNVGDRVFPVDGSRLWNSLPTDVTSTTTLPVFCSRLKSYLFSVSSPCMTCVRLTLTLFSAFAVCI